jgi:RNA polymerase sigma factor (sigma-70 family)
MLLNGSRGTFSMTREPSAAILDPLRRLITRQTGSSLSDAQLLENFVTRRDEASFEVLVWRHGAMVLAVCKRVLRDSHEAEDAFQATFLVFARKAESIGRGEVVAAWLYKVAYRVALRLRVSVAKLSTSGEPTDAIPAPEVTGSADWLDLRPVLDDEIARLPEKYRAPFVLCYLEGRTNEEAATALGCPKGTVLSRLSRGREWLRSRLARRGVALSATAFALALSQNAASASVPAALVPPIVGAAGPFATGTAAAQLVPAHIAALTEGVLKTMTLFKVKTAAALVALALFGTGLAWAARGGTDAPAPAPVSAPEARAAHAEARTEANTAADGQREGQRDRPATVAPAISGNVTAVAQDGKSFTFETPPTERGGEPTKTTVKIGDKTTVLYDGVGRDGAKPTEGYAAKVSFEAGSKEVAAAVTFMAGAGWRGFDAAGQVGKVTDNKSLTLVVHPRDEPGREGRTKTIPLDDKTVLIFSNVGKDGAKITEGQQAMVWYADDGKTAGKVHFVGTAEERRRDEKRPDVVGKVRKVAPDGKTLTVEVPPTTRDGEPTMVTITLSDKATVLFHNVLANEAQVVPGLHAQVWLADASKNTAAKVSLTGTVPERWTTVSGKVVAVAKGGNSFTIEHPAAVRGEEPKRTEIKLTERTKVAFFGVGPDGAKIAEGMMAQATLLDGSADTASLVTFRDPSTRPGGRER